MTMYRLQSCAQGYKVINTGANGAFSHDVQTCSLCGKGEECNNASCVVCTPCEPGSYKAAVSTDACLPCPANTYREDPGATDIANCASCLAKSSTAGLTGQRSWRSCVCDSSQYRLVANTASDSCIACPPGLICRGEGPVDAVVSNSTWMAEGTFYKLQSCPKGYYVFPMGLTSLDTASASQQKCMPCDAGEVKMKLHARNTHSGCNELVLHHTTWQCTC
jgi:hypothetical protein